MLRHTRRHNLMACGNSDRSSPMSTADAEDRVSAAPPPIAIETGQWDIAGASLIPSPTYKTFRLCASDFSTRADFSSGVRPYSIFTPAISFHRGAESPVRMHVSRPRECNRLMVSTVVARSCSSRMAIAAASPFTAIYIYISWPPDFSSL